MLLNAPKTGGASREVLFRLGIVADPGAPATFKRFGDSIIGEQGRISAAARQHAARMSADWKSAANEQATHLDRVAKAAEASASRVAEAYKRAGRDATTAMRSIPAAPAPAPIPTATGGSRAAAASRLGAASSGLGRIGGEDLSRLGSGLVNVGAGIAMTGLLDEKDSEKLVSGLLNIFQLSMFGKGLFDTAAFGMKVAGGIGGGAAAGAAGGAAGGGAGSAAAAALSGPAIPLIAAAAAAAVLYVGFRQGQDISSGKSVHGKPDDPFQRGSMFTRFNPLADVLGYPFDRSGDTRSIVDIYGDANAAADRGDSQLRAAGREKALNRARESSGEQLRAGELELARRITETRVEQLRIAKEERETSFRASTARLDASEKELGNARRLLETRKEEATAARGKFGSDLERFADLDPLDQARLARIKGKVDRGGTLTRDESGLAGQFNEFRNAASRSNELRGLAAGGAGIFTSGARSVAESQRLVGEAANQAAQLDLNVKKELVLNVRLQKPGASEQQAQREIDLLAKNIKALVDQENANTLSIDELRKNVMMLRAQQQNLARAK
ncbi:MAG TPA: hypothetical protein VMP01_08965 [Pirellulaceae bacterium]|nr:hypothetical protein [Pirellulaceae bacterium]